MNNSPYRRAASYLYSALFCGVILVSFYALLRVNMLAHVVPYIEAHRMYGALIFGLLMCIATVVAPITLLPAVPMVAPILGPGVTAVSCALGWTVGATLAFLIARHGGRPLIMRFVSLRALDEYEKRVPEKAELSLLIALRMCIPVDVLSYALGLFSRMSLTTYVLGTFIGVVWFSVAFSYLGYSFFSGNAVHFSIYSVASGTIFLGALLYTRHALRRNSGH